MQNKRTQNRITRQQTLRHSSGDNVRTVSRQMYTLPIKCVNTAYSFGYRESVIVTCIVFVVKATGRGGIAVNACAGLYARPLRRPSVATMRFHVTVCCLPQSLQLPSHLSLLSCHGSGQRYE